MKVNKNMSKAARRAKTFPAWFAKQEARKAAEKATAKAAGLRAIEGK